MTEGHDDATIARLMAEVRELRAEVAALQADRGHPDQRATAAGDLAGEVHTSTTRRDAIRLAGTAAAAAVVGVVASAEPAAAADPNDVVRNVLNATTASTGLDGSMSSEVLRVRNSGPSGRAIYGISGGPDIGAVRGDNANSTGIGGVGVSGYAPGGRDFLAFGSGRIGMNSHTFSLVTNSYTQGEIHHSAGTLYAMVNSTERRSIVGPNTAGGALYPIDPVRVYDSRKPTPDPGRLAGGESRVVLVAHSRNPDTGALATSNVVPLGATAIVFNLTVVDTAGSGYLRIARGTAATFSASIVNWTTSGVTLANASTVPLDDARRVRVFCGTGSTHFVLDVMGYYL